MASNKAKIFVIGATGQIGSELTVNLRKRYGPENVVAAGHRRKADELIGAGPFEILDATNKKDVAAIVEKYDVNTIYHLAAVLSGTGEQNQHLAWQVNMESLHNVLEVALERGVLKVFWPSSIAVFGPETPQNGTPQNTILIPRTIYGVTKVAGELLCNYYFNKFGLDVRSVRFPGVISHETLPGGGTTDYAVEIFYEAIKEKKYTCFLREDATLPMIYMPDCIKAIVNLMEADKSRIRCRTAYNLASMSFSPEELAAEIKKYIPEFRCSYEPDFRQGIADSWPKSLDDSVAREEWGWNPDYDLPSMTRDMIDKITSRISKP
jgi:nucleoside-diphosphate-sugar epimerase